MGGNRRREVLSSLIATFESNEVPLHMHSKMDTHTHTKQTPGEFCTTFLSVFSFALTQCVVLLLPQAKILENELRSSFSFVHFNLKITLKCLLFQ